MSPSVEKQDVFRNDQQQLKSAFYTRRMTRIPLPWDKPFQACTPLVQEAQFSELAETIRVFMRGSSQELRNWAGIHLYVQDFPAQSPEDQMLVAKNYTLERDILTQLFGIETPVGEYEDAFQLIARRKPDFAQIHGRRDFDFCAFHKACGTSDIHCALDDTIYLAKKLEDAMQ